MDIRAGFNAISDVIANRPHPLREFDQIYMKGADMLIQAEHVSNWLADKETVFIGDGDALGLCLVHLKQISLLERGPSTVHVLDFDERVINSIQRFAERWEYEDRVTASLYNVADPLPLELLGKYRAFYTNPPYGSSNGGVSVRAFLERGLAATTTDATCCAVLADCPDLSWCSEVLASAQKFLLDNGCVITELVPRFHSYHLDDDPSLTSCSLIASRLRPSTHTLNNPLEKGVRDNFYGRGAALNIRYVKDLTNGGKLRSRDYETVPF